jgi:hypothetical protein
MVDISKPTVPSINISVENVGGALRAVSPISISSTPVKNIASQTHTWAIQGIVSLADVPPMTVLKESTEDVKLVQMICSIGSGTSIDMKFQKNGVDISETSVTVTTTPTDVLFTTPEEFDNGDEITLLLSNLQNNPQDFSVTIRLRRTI